METRSAKASFSIPSIIALIAAVLSFFANPAVSLLLAFVAIAAGLIGIILSFSPSVRGGVISTLSLGAAGIAVFIALVRILARMF